MTSLIKKFIRSDPMALLLSERGVDVACFGFTTALVFLFFCFEQFLVKLLTTEAIGKKETRVTKAQAAILLIQYRISITGRSK